MSDTKRYTAKRSHVSCNAANCSFNEDGASCSAERIDVSGHRAESEGETCCSTFRRKT